MVKDLILQELAMEEKTLLKEVKDLVPTFTPEISHPNARLHTVPNRLSFSGFSHNEIHPLSACCRYWSLWGWGLVPKLATWQQTKLLFLH